MRTTASPLTLLAVFSFSAGCGYIKLHRATPRASSPPTATASALNAEPLAPSARLIVGRVIAVDAARALAFVELGADPPRAALADGTELVARTLELRETARLQASRHARGRTLGTRIVSGQPSPGDEVVWLAP